MGELLTLLSAYPGASPGESGPPRIANHTHATVCFVDLVPRLASAPAVAWAAKELLDHLTLLGSVSACSTHASAAVTDIGAAGRTHGAVMARWAS
jgi:hypothetical protein